MGNLYSTSIQPEANRGSSNYSNNANVSDQSQRGSWYNEFIFEDPPEDDMNQNYSNRNMVKGTESADENIISTSDEVVIRDEIKNALDKKEEQLYLAAIIKKELIEAVLNAFDKILKKGWKKHLKIDFKDGKAVFKDAENLERKVKKVVEKKAENWGKIILKTDKVNKIDDKEGLNQKAQEQFETSLEENQFDPSLKATSSEKKSKAKRKSRGVYIVENDIRVQRSTNGVSYKPRLVSPNTSIAAPWMTVNDRAETPFTASDAPLEYDLTMKEICDEYGFSLLGMINAIKHSRKGYIDLRSYN